MTVENNPEKKGEIDLAPLAEMHGAKTRLQELVNQGSVDRETIEGVLSDELEKLKKAAGYGKKVDAVGRVLGNPSFAKVEADRLLKAVGVEVKTPKRRGGVVRGIRDWWGRKKP